MFSLASVCFVMLVLQRNFCEKLLLLLTRLSGCHRLCLSSIVISQKLGKIGP